MYRIIKNISFFLIAVIVLNFSCIANSYDEMIVELGGIGFDMEINEAQNLLYVSVPSRNEIVVISLKYYEVIDRIIVGSLPHGIDLSQDGYTLYIALNDAGAVAYLDLHTKEVMEVIVEGELGDPRAYDVIEPVLNDVFVSANPGGSGFAWIVRINRDEDNAKSRVADERIIRGDPIFAASPDQQFLYVGEGFTPNSLYKLDITPESAPIVLEDQHGLVSGTDNLDVSPDGSRIYLASGQVLRTDTFFETGVIGGGPSKLILNKA